MKNSQGIFLAAKLIFILRSCRFHFSNTVGFPFAGYMDYRSLFRENKNRKNSGRDLGLLPVHGCNMLMLPLRTPSIGLANHVSFVFP